MLVFPEICDMIDATYKTTYKPNIPLIRSDFEMIKSGITSNHNLHHPKFLTCYRPTPKLSISHPLLCITLPCSCCACSGRFSLKNRDNISSFVCHSILNCFYHPCLKGRSGNICPNFGLKNGQVWQRVCHQQISSPQIRTSGGARCLESVYGN